MFTHPRDGAYVSETWVVYGGEVDLTDTVLGLVLRTGAFPRE